MNKKPLILGIETSCDETAASLISENDQGIPIILSNVISSQTEVHKNFGGVVPELAARSHLEKIDWIVQKALDKSGKKIDEIDAVAATAGPGLVVCLSVGLSFGKTFANLIKKPFIAVNHLEGHALSPKLNANLNYPYLLLLISGGHSQYLCVNDLGSYQRLGTTIDDALGEAFDKTAKLMGLPYPGGPEIESLAKKGIVGKFDFPRPLKNKKNCDFSFSGLKTHILQTWNKAEQTDQIKADIALELQHTVVDCLQSRLQNAIEQTKATSVVVSGGVTANQFIRTSLEDFGSKAGLAIYYPSKNFCTDNGAMIAYAGYLKYAANQLCDLEGEVRARWPLSET